MDGSQFDALLRQLTSRSSRRTIMRRTIMRGVATVLGLGAVRFPMDLRAKKRNKKLRFNEFGCVNVGGKCRGKDGVCCSGICRGKKPKKGQKDTSRCLAHHEGICTQGQDVCTHGIGLATRCSLNNPSCFCFTTTGHAGFCGAPSANACVLCRADPDCVTFGFPQGSACVRVDPAGSCNCAPTGDRACVPPCV